MRIVRVSALGRADLGVSLALSGVEQGRNDGNGAGRVEHVNDRTAKARGDLDRRVHLARGRTADQQRDLCMLKTVSE
jgi:hypothetical protein